jgi:hypothetical protein
MRFLLPLALIALTTLAVVWGKPVAFEVREHSTRPDYVIFQRCVGLGCSERKPYATKRGTLEGLGLFDRHVASGTPSLFMGARHKLPGPLGADKRETATPSTQSKPLYSKVLNFFCTSLLGC